jgi:transcriptional regulator with XRE-family HTH domain
MRGSTVGPLIRERRHHSRRSQMDLALDIGISPRHLSFVELGKSRPSTELLMLLAERLDLPLRQRNDWLLAAGYAPRYTETPLEGPVMERVKRSLQNLLDAHDPFPGLVIDRSWTVQLTNQAAIRLAEGIPDAVRGVPSNIFRVSLHPDGFARRTRNFPEWSAYLLRQLDLVVTRTRDSGLEQLVAEVVSWPNIPDRETWSHLAAYDEPALVVPWKLQLGDEELSMFTTMSTFGTPLDVTLSELTIELFFPADEATDATLRRLGTTSTLISRRAGGSICFGRGNHPIHEF